NVTEAFEGIDPARVTVVSGATYDPATGEVSGYQNGTPIKYTYDAGTMANGVPVILNVTLTFTVKIPTTITLQYSDKQYTGNPVPLPTNNEYTTTGGSTGNVTFKWYAANDTTTEISAPINVGEYKVKAFLSATNTHGAAESDFVDFRINPIPSSITINNYVGKVYDGQAVVDPADITRTQNNANVTFEYYHQDDLTTPIAAPSEVGRYAVKAFLRGDTNYIDSESNTVLFEITKVDSKITVDYEDKLYDGNEVIDPTEYTIEGGSTGEVSFKWYEKYEDEAGNITWTVLKTKPVNVGMYGVKAILAETDTHERAESNIAEFRVTPAPSSITIDNYAGKVYDGQAVVDPTEITRTENNANVTFEYYNQDDLTKPIAAPSEVGKYAVKAFLRGDTNYIDSESNIVLFEITKIASKITVEYEDKVYDTEFVEDPTKYTVEGGSTGEVSFKWYEKNEDEAGNVTWKELTTKPVNVSVYGVKAVLAETDTHEGAESGVVEFRVTPAPSTIEIKDNLNKVYDGEVVEDPTDIEKTGSSGAVSYEWYEKEVARSGEETWKLLEKAPQDAGDYKVKAYLEADQNYLAAEGEKEFTIEKAPSKVTIEEELDKDYDGVEVKVPQISIEGSSGTVTFTWYQKDEHGEWIKLESAPKEAGSYKVEVTLEEDRNYLSATAEKEFT
ncbi:MAG: MBG domain-containing protein, partial [Erysipelotrichaceae bacterium]|nr:MBG domain-containing protein [Erysipelotrichaceae bacterium]